MPTIQHVLCPVDFSEASTHAVDHAVAIAAASRARISALHVVLPTTIPALAGEMPELSEREPDLARLRERTAGCFRAAAAAGVELDVLVDEGDPARGILDRAATLAADLIVMGTHGAGGFEHLVLGSVTERVLRKAGCPVLTVPPRVSATSQLPFKRLLCAVDFSDSSREGLRMAVSLARESGASLTLLHVLEWPWHEPPAPSFGELSIPQAEALKSYRHDRETSALSRLRALAGEAAPDGISIEPLVRHGKSYVEILRVAADEGTDLLVLGVHGRAGLDMLLLGSTTNQTVRSATCPVLTVRR